jgi:hypothetical protein
MRNLARNLIIFICLTLVTAVYADYKIRTDSGDSILLQTAGSATRMEIDASGNINIPGLTINRATIIDGSGNLTVSSVTDTTLGYLDATSSVQTQLDGKQPLDGDLTAISALATTGVMKRTGAETYGTSNVNLTSEVTGVLPIANGGTNSSTALSNDFAIVSSGGAIVESSTISTTELGYLDTVSSNIQTQLDAKVADTGNESIAGEKTFTGRLLTSSTTASSRPAPVMTEAQRDLIGSPADGDMVYNSDTDQLNVYDGAAWQAIASGGFTTTDWASGTFTSANFGTVSNANIYWKREGQMMRIKYFFTCGTPGAGAAEITIPNSKSVDSGSTIIDASNDRNMVGRDYQIESGQTHLTPNQNTIIHVSSNDWTKLYFSNAPGSNTAFDRDTGTTICASTASRVGEALVPISGW